MKLYNPFIYAKMRTPNIMFDVIFALLPLVLFAYWARGNAALILIGVAVFTAIISEFVLSWFYLKKKNSIFDASAIISALLLTFTLSPKTPWYIVAFGAFAAVFFGKITWGGLGKNKFNPALLGREFMVAFFPAIMASATIWSIKIQPIIKDIYFFESISDSGIALYMDTLLYKSTGALGEHSILFLIIGGLYLLIRNRISWHTPLGFLLTFFLLTEFWLDKSISYSIASVLLGLLFMATDMPSSPSNNVGKFYYGLAIAAIAVYALSVGVRHEYMSYSILILNGFVSQINKVFKPIVWGEKLNWKVLIEQVFLLSLLIGAMALAIVQLHKMHYIPYLVFAYMLYIILKFSGRFGKDKENLIHS